MEEFNYIVVSVFGEVQVGNYDFASSEWKGNVIGEQVEMSLIKAGGERIEEIGTTGSSYGETSIHGVFNLYKEQPIEFKARLVNYPAVYGSTKVEWNDIERTATINGDGKPRTNSVKLFIALKIPVDKQ